MYKLITYVLLFASVVGNAQSVFTWLVKNPENEKNAYILDSCASIGYYKDSVLYYRGYLALKKNDLQQARVHCKELLKTYPGFTEAHFLNGLIFLAGKNYGKSVTELNVVLEKNPKHIKALYNRALAFGLMEEYDKAINDLTACVELRPMYSLAYYSRGYWNEFLGNYTAAIKDYETTINLDPKNYDAYLGLAYIYQGLKSNTKSCEIINDAIKAGSQIAEEVKDNFCR